MFSGIRDLLRTTGVARDPQPQNATVRPKDEDATGGRQYRDEPAQDDTLFSITAIRALLTTEPLPADLAAALGAEEKKALLEGLAALEAQGIHNIPLRLGQSLLDAVRAALPRA